MRLAQGRGRRDPQGRRPVRDRDGQGRQPDRGHGGRHSAPSAVRGGRHHRRAGPGRDRRNEVKAGDGMERKPEWLRVRYNQQAVSEVAELMRDLMGLREKEHFIATRRGVLDPKTLSKEDYQKLIHEKPAYGQIICRCEQVTEGEILDAIHRPLGAKSLDGVKRRTRAGMGRCQAGFCSPRVMEILARELHVDQSEITKCGGASRLIVGTNKDKLEEVQDK